MITHEQLADIEAKSTIAPPSLLRLHANEVRCALGSLTGELRSHAEALLLKLEHLEHDGQAELSSSAALGYLAPGLTLGAPLQAAA
jgi:hypothetical protein